MPKLPSELPPRPQHPDTESYEYLKGAWRDDLKRITDVLERRPLGDHIDADSLEAYNESLKFSRGRIKLAELAVNLGATLLRKNSDYGASVWQPAKLVPESRPGDRILIRLEDKIARLQSLRERDQTPLIDESMEETMLDVAGYALLWLADPNREPKQQS